MFIQIIFIKKINDSNSEYFNLINDKVYLKSQKNNRLCVKLSYYKYHNIYSIWDDVKANHNRRLAEITLWDDLTANHNIKLAKIMQHPITP